MANLKISELPAAGALTGAELIESVQGGINVQTTTQDIADLGGGGGGHVIEDEGTPLTQRTKLNFVGGGVAVTDDSGDDATVVTVEAGTRQMVVIDSDVANTTTSFADATDLKFPVVNAGIYWFKFVVDYTAAATTTGSKWSINGPSASRLNYQEKFVNSSTTESYQPGYTTYDTGVVTGASTTSALAFIEGFITASASGDVICRFASEVGGSAITVKSGSFVEFVQLN